MGINYCAFCSKSLPSFAKVCTFHAINSSHPCYNIMSLLPKSQPGPAAKGWGLEGRKGRLLSLQLLILGLKCDIKINFIMAVYKIIVAAGNDNPKQHLLKKIPKLLGCSLGSAQEFLRADLEGMLKWSLNFPLAAGSPQ